MQLATLWRQHDRAAPLARGLNGMAFPRAASSSTVGPAATVADSDEKSRRLCVRLIFLIYGLYLVEGMLRKWLLPQLQQPLFFLRDPFVLLLYWIAFSRGLVRVRGWLAVWIGVAVVTSTIGVTMLAVNGIGAPGWILALRSYWLYLPLAFVVGAVFTLDDLRRFVMLNLVIAIPVAMLAFLQYRSSPDAFINRGTDAEMAVATVLRDVVRPYGVFTYTSQHVNYAATLSSILALAWVTRKQLSMPFWILPIATLATLVVCLTTGSRSIYALLVMVALMLVVVTLITRNAGMRGSSLMFLTLFAVTAIVLFSTVLRPALEIMLERQAVAQEAEGSTLGRGMSGLTSFLDVMDDAPILGQGLGIGTSTVARYRSENFTFTYTAENEWERHILELGPLFGLLFIGVRIVFVAWLAMRSVKAARSGSPEGLLLFGFAGSSLLNGQITFSTINGFTAWLFAGLILAMSDPERAEKASEFGRTASPSRLAWAVKEPKGPWPRGGQPRSFGSKRPPATVAERHSA